MYRLKTLIPILSLAWLTACGFLPELDDVLPDQRDEYRSSRSLPPLEVPPDLTSDTLNDSMAIPGEGDPNTLSAYERQQQSGGAVLGVAMADEQTLLVQGDQLSIWPQLQSFWREQGYVLELDDAELGVLETGWSEPRATVDGEMRERFRVFAEPGSQNNTTVLFVSHEQQRRAAAGEEWVDAGSESQRREDMAAALSSHLGGGQQIAANTNTGSSSPVPASREPASSVARAEIINNDQGQVYMSLPDGFDQAWDKLDAVLVDTGMEVRSADVDKGEYLLAYQPPEDEDKSWFDALKFWSSDEPTLYRLSVTAASDRTEVILRDEDGEWLSDDAARNLLYQIQQQYNR